MLFECVGWLVVFVFDGCSSVIVLVRYCCLDQFAVLLICLFTVQRICMLQRVVDAG